MNKESFPIKFYQDIKQTKYRFTNSHNNKYTYSTPVQTFYIGFQVGTTKGNKEVLTAIFGLKENVDPNDVRVRVVRDDDYPIPKHEYHVKSNTSTKSDDSSQSDDSSKSDEEQLKLFFRQMVRSKDGFTLDDYSGLMVHSKYHALKNARSSRILPRAFLHQITKCEGPILIYDNMATSYSNLLMKELDGLTTIQSNSCVEASGLFNEVRVTIRFMWNFTRRHPTVLYWHYEEFVAHHISITTHGYGEVYDDGKAYNVVENVVLLSQAFKAFKKQFLEHGIDVSEYRTIEEIGMDYIRKRGCLDGVEPLGAVDHVLTLCRLNLEPIQSKNISTAIYSNLYYLGFRRIQGFPLGGIKHFDGYKPAICQDDWLCLNEPPLPASGCKFINKEGRGCFWTGYNKAICEVAKTVDVSEKYTLNTQWFELLMYGVYSGLIKEQYTHCALLILTETRKAIIEAQNSIN